MKTKLLPILLLALVAACAPNSPKLQGPAVQPGRVQLSVAKAEAETNSQVDILFVIDNSISMKQHQANLAANIDKFVKAFSKNGMIDYHVGVTTVYDSKKFGTVVKDFLPIGTLIAPKDATGAAIGTLPYLTRNTPDFMNVLASTLKVGTKDGPEFEESFSPVTAALSNPSNGDFYRPNAYLVIFFITDADDSSALSFDEFYAQLLAAKNGQREKVMTYGVLATQETGFCKMDPSGAPNKIVNFLSLAQGSAFSLCSPSFGDKLAKIGTKLGNVVGRQVIKLTGVPVKGSFTVSYGSQVIPADSEKGWGFDSETNELIISGQLEVTPEEGAKINYEYTTPVSLSRARVAK